MTLTSAGSTFIYPILAKWSEKYESQHPNIRIMYDPVGSGHGIARTLAGTVDFGASDGPLSDLQVQHAPRKLVHVPVVLGGVVPSYNLPGVTQDLRFTSRALAGIYLGTITKWNDPEIARANPDLHLPGHEITVIFRTDGSGTTYVWADYLSKVSSTWSKQVGRGTSVRFPVGEGAQFNEGVQKLIKETPYSIGYLQVTYAEEGHVQTGLVENSTGKFVKGDSAGITAAAAATATHMPADFRVSITNAPDSECLSDIEFYLAPCARTHRRPRQEGGDSGISAMGAHGWSEDGEPAALRAVTGGDNRSSAEGCRIEFNKPYKCGCGDAKENEHSSLDRHRLALLRDGGLDRLGRPAAALAFDLGARHG